MTPEVLETACEWMTGDVADSAQWTEVLSDAEVAEIDAAMAVARAKSPDLLAIGKSDFPLPTLAPRLRRIEEELMSGRGFVLIRGLPRARYTNDDMCLAVLGNRRRTSESRGTREPPRSRPPETSPTRAR